MLNLTDAHYFVQVVDHRGFAAASRRLDLPKSTISHRIGELERTLGVRLLNRNSRHFSVTESGAEFYRHARELLDRAATAEDAMRIRLAEPAGIVRMTTVPELSQHVLCDLLPDFLGRHPKVSIVEEATDRFVDILSEGFDLAIRGHNEPLADSALIQRRIAAAPWLLFASSRYLEDNGMPVSPADLAGHRTLSLSRPSAGPHWMLRGPDGMARTVDLAPRFRTNSLVSLKTAACADLGIAALPGYICKHEIVAGSLVRVLPGWTAMDASFSAILPHRSGLSPAVRALLDFLADELPGRLTLDR